MVYLEYHKESKQVVEIHKNEPTTSIDYDYAISNDVEQINNLGDAVIVNDFKIGDEFKQTIWINEVDENKNVISYSVIRNNPQAKRLLEENAQLKEENTNLKLAVAELAEVQEQTKLEMQLALVELAESVIGGA